MEITVNGKTEHFSLCLECYEKLIDIALDEELI